MISQANKFKSILQKKEAPKLNEDFDSKMMSIIHKHSVVKDTNKKNIRLIYLFFILGLILGLNVSFSIENIRIPFIDLSINRYFIGIPLIISLMFVFDKVYKISQYQKGNNEIFKI